MSSTNYKLLHTRDERLTNQPVHFAVKTGGSSISNVEYNAQSKSTTSHSWQINPPAGVFIDRRVMWKSKFRIKLSGIARAGVKLAEYGSNTVLAPFPLHEMCLNQTAQVNGSSVSVNVNDIKAGLLQLYRNEDLALLNSTSPTQADAYYDYVATSAFNNSPFRNYSQISGSNIPRGAYSIDAINAGANGNGADNRDVYITVSVEEPLLFLSPFAHIGDRSGIWGCTNLNFIFNLNASNTNNRVIRSSKAGVEAGGPLLCVIDEFIESKLILKYITPQANQVIDPICSLPYYETPRYITSIPAFAGDSNTVNMDTITINSIPDSLLIFVRKQLSSQTVSDSDSFFPITNIKINWNNNSGLLGTENEQSLFNITKSNGVNTDWLRYHGVANCATNADETLLCGAILKLDMGRDVVLEPYQSAGSVGQYTLGMTVTYTNQQLNVPCELVVVAVNSGVFVINSGGTSQIFTSILTKNDVLTATEEEPVPHQHIERLIGGSWMNKLKTIGSHVLPYIKKHAPAFREHVLEKSENPYLQTAGKVMKAVGYGKSGGALHKYIK